MKKTPTTKHFGKGWKVLAVVVMIGYTMSSVRAFQASAAQLNPPAQPQVPSSFQQEIETQVASLLYGAWDQLVGFMQAGMPQNEGAGSGTIPLQNPTQTLSQTTLPSVKKEGKNQISDLVFPLIHEVAPIQGTQSKSSFSDIDTEKNRESIEILSSIGIFQGDGKGKFFPQNHVRYSDFIRVIFDLYRYKLGYSSSSQNGYSDIPHFDSAVKDSLLLKKLNTAYALGLLDGIGEIDIHQPISPKQALQIINNTLNLNPSIGSLEQTNLIDTSTSVLTKAQMAQYLVAIFQLEKSSVNSVFNDIGNHKHRDAINRLAQLGVVAGKHGKFYPDAMVLREDGIIMITNGLLASQGKALVINNFTHINPINDTTYFAAYAPHLEYLLTNEIGDFLLYPQLSGYLFSPHAQLTKGEAYTLISQAARVKLLNADSGSSAEPLTRGELADLIVHAFNFDQKDIEPTTSTQVYSGAANHYVALREEKKGVLISFLKDVLDMI